MNTIRFALSSVVGASIFSLASVAVAATSDLPRKPFLGVQVQPAQGAAGVAVGTILPGGTAEVAGLKAGDIITAINGRAVTSPGDVVAAAQAIKTGQDVAFAIRRAGQPLAVSGKAKPRPFERYDGASVDYGAVAFRGGHLRDVLVMPNDAPSAPVVFYIQGYSCGPVEGGPPDGLYHWLGDSLIKQGIGFYRVEKIGMGDSVGPLNCTDVDYATELDGFRAAYRHLVADRKIPADRIFMLGHSMGGLQAPMLAAERAPRGVAVYGTVVRNWGDYVQDLSATQDFLIGGADPVESAKRGEDTRDLTRMFYFQKLSPAEIAKAKPQSEQALRELFNWDGGTKMYGRSYKFAQDLSSLPLIQAWKDSKTNVLSIYGESDMVALTDVDHRYLADIVNYWRPGTARFVAIPDTFHGMERLGSRAAIRAANRAEKPLDGPFNPAVANVLGEWIRASMAKPPVAG